MKKAYIIHGWGGSPDESLHKWLKQQLESHNFKVHILKMPDTNNPKIKEWVDCLNEEIFNPNKDTYLIGHSIGCQAILRYLESLSENLKVKGVVLIAPFIHLLDTAYENPEEEKKIAKPWLETPLNWNKIIRHAQNFTAIFSDNDFCVPLSDKEIFKERLNAQIIIEHNKGHFTEEDNVTQLPSALASILEMSK